MKRISVVILFLIISQFLIARKDSVKFNNFRGFYINTYYPYKFYGSYSGDYKYPEDHYYLFNSKGYQYQTPGIGLGYVINHREMFIKTDFNYWYGSKSLDDYFSFASPDKNSGDNYESFPSFSNQYPPIGYQYYKIKDHYTGHINFHYFDIGFAITGNITRYLRIYSGWRMNFMFRHSYKGKINREASLYEVKRYNSQYDRVDSLIQTENLQYTDIASKSSQNFTSYLFYNLGINVNFKIKGKLFIADLLIETTSYLPSQGGAMAGCATFKLAYVFNYSTYFGKKKVKD